MDAILEKLSNHFLDSNLIQSLDAQERKNIQSKLLDYYQNNHLSKRLTPYHSFFQSLDSINFKQNKQLLSANNSINFEVGITETEKKLIQLVVEALKPWHKGVFKIADLVIDGQWDCNHKWQRIAPILKNCFSNQNENLNILDIGCGNGYFLWRIVDLLGQYSKKIDSNLVLGIDHHLLYMLQFYLFFKITSLNYDSHTPIFLPLDDNHFFQLCRPNQAKQKTKFDIILSMGLLYHQKNPISHLQQIKKNLKNNHSVLILETLVLDDSDNPNPEVLIPKDNYCKMSNVWFVPNLAMLKLWLEKLKFRKIELVNVSETNGNEQRATNLSQNWGAEDAIDYQKKKTIEGYDSPVRAVLKVQL